MLILRIIGGTKKAQPHRLKEKPTRPNKTLKPRNSPIRVGKRRKRRCTKEYATNKRTEKVISQLLESMRGFQNRKMLA